MKEKTAKKDQRHADLAWEKKVHVVTVGEIIKKKNVLLRIHAHSSIEDALTLMGQYGILSLPVFAKAGHWSGAGGVEVYAHNGEIQYIGIISILDIVAHLAEQTDEKRPDALKAHVSGLIGKTNESLSMWAFKENTTLFEVLEPMSKGIHRALVTVTEPDTETGKDVDECKLVTQSDIVHYLDTLHAEDMTQQTVQDLLLVKESLLTVPSHLSVVQALRTMITAGVHAAPVVHEGSITATLSASDFRGVHAKDLVGLSKVTVSEYLERKQGTFKLENVTCQPDTKLGEVLRQIAKNHIHRVWVVKANALHEPVGVITLTDIIGVFYRHAKA
eukprot:TRINITY_DN18683_c0_g1::TRINITY_DN18683_c0_g1_i1::g.20388::m.20388 TRINITY_DN18683_c0_g1::TRINITY_DN18683_c0_g1_i1::g.20388  ORF type:complete len:359 (-),score=94.88,sp/Q8GXI9/PV42B_ARATH/31.66/6e-38,CBS/PF00571.23/0.055,CBS/PF00571.23/33,CBS/PF00571.23/1.5e-05,CBS/PF00571.23/7.4e-12,GTP_cyclohydro2/PF00925.15/0.063,GTP_cyclohydro2/PF00925.15/2.6e+03 TRINITY_DN18683_c0_g1_i1:231-1223(-)